MAQGNLCNCNQQQQEQQHHHYWISEREGEYWRKVETRQVPTETGRAAARWGFRKSQSSAAASVGESKDREKEKATANMVASLAQNLQLLEDPVVGHSLEVASNDGFLVPDSFGNLVPKIFGLVLNWDFFINVGAISIPQLN